MNLPRSSGVLLHPTSLPGPSGIGELGESARRFVDFLHAGKQQFWQILPLGPTGYGNSPYACYSAFAGNTLLISLQDLVTDGLLTDDDLSLPPSFSTTEVEFDRVRDYKERRFKKAFASFQTSQYAPLVHAFEIFCRGHADWLNDFALFRALKDAHAGAIWTEWDSGLVRRDPDDLAKARTTFAKEIQLHKFTQFLFFKQWFELRAYCQQRGVRIIGDIPIFVALDSADVWTEPAQFKLDEERNPVVVAGVPPDYFSETGQLWGNPIYDWNYMAADGFRWWVRRVQATFQLVDLVRVDHFRGFQACWEIPAGDKTAERGSWVEAPGKELFQRIRESLGEVPIIAEDLGVITPEVEQLRDGLGFPGMRVLQFGFGNEPSSMNLPHHYVRNLVAYTGTHDNDTTVGWFAGVDDAVREFCLKYVDSDGDEINWEFIRTIFASVANVAVVPLQDLLGLGNDARMNLPNSTDGNWTWRFPEGALTNEIATRLRTLTETYGR
jgi:4-alpha-glucanotransferase